MRRAFLFLWLSLIIGTNLIAQVSQVKGIVLSDEDGEPVIGASILVKGTNRGAITDLDGNFVIGNLPGDATTLVVSYMGMKTQEAAIRPELTIILESDSKVLSEVVVTALGIQRQAKELGYATARISGEDLNAAKGTDAAASLMGKVSGLQINLNTPLLDSDARINLRGSRSFKGDNSALLVLDGVQTPVDFLQSINPNDIENISVLKGAGAAALYGSAAANGVLYVTTKQGNRGKPNITYSLTTTFDKVAYLPKMQTRFGAGTHDPTTGLPTYYISDENQQYGPEFDGSMKEVGSPLYDLNDPDGYYLTLPYSYVKNGRENFYQTGVGIQNDISYSSSDENGSMFISYQRLDKTGILEGDKQVRQTLRFNGSRKYKNLNVGAKVSYSNTNFDLSADSNSGIYNLINVPGNINLNDFRNWSDPNVTGASPNEWINDYYQNPWFTIDNERRKIRRDNVTFSIDMDYQALSWLKLQARGGVSVGVTNRNDTRGAWHYSDWARDNIYYASADILSYLYTRSSLNSRLDLDFMASTQHKLNDDFELRTMIGYSIQETYYEYKRVNAARLQVDNLYNLSNKIGELTGQNEWRKTRKLGLYGSVDLGFKGYAFLQLTARNDWNSLLDPSNWSFFYPSANISVVLSDAIKTLQDHDVISHLKVRASAARVGTVNLKPYLLNDIVETANYFPYGTLAGYSLSKDIYNKNLEPEFTTEFEIGAEIGLLRDRIFFEAAIYNQETTNQTVNVALPTSTGYATRYVNAGTMRGRGLEMDLRITPLIKLGQFRWNVGVNATFVNTKVTELVDGLDELLTASGYAVYAIAGQSYPMIKATDWVRDPQGRVIVDAVTGLPTAGDLVAVGSADPKVRLGLNTNIKFKDFTLAATFDYRGGHYTRFGLEYNMLFTGSSYISALGGRQRFVFPNSVIAQTDNNENVTYVENTDVTINNGGKNFWNGVYQQGRANQVIRADSWRLRELSLGYEVPDYLVKQTKVVQRASISFVARNLFMWVPKNNYWGDPDYTASGDNNAPGMAGTNAAGSRTFGFNILASF